MAFNAFMHERNIYRNQPDFVKLVSVFPDFQKYTIPDIKGQKLRVDFSNTEALRMLTKILLKKDFNLDIEIPEGFLIPTVPQRLNYILWLEDLLSTIFRNESKEENTYGIDIGTGACAIFAVLGAQKNGWKFTATESSDAAIIWAKKNIEKNNLHERITVVKVNHGGSSLDEVLSSNEDCFHFCMCNPPFFENSEEIRKKYPNSNETIADVSQKDEIFVKGGELDFVRNILKDSIHYKNRVCIFTSMFGKKKSFLQILKDLKEVPDVKFTNTEFCQGNTIRWGVAWTFDQSICLQQEVKKRSKPKKTKPPLEYEVFINNPKKSNLNSVVKQAKTVLKSLEIHFTVVRSSPNFTELLLKSDKNTWTHQRRKRRQLERQKIKDENTTQSLETVPSVDNLSNNNSSEENDNLKDSSEILKDCKMETDILCPQEVNALNKVTSESISSTLESESDKLLLSTNESKCTNDTSLLQNNKRKFDQDSECSPISKKAKVSDTEDNIDKSLMLNSKDEVVSKFNMDTPSLLISGQHALISSSDTEAVPSDNCKRNSLSEVKNSSKSTEVDEIKDINNDHKMTGNAEPEGSLLYCYLQFLKGKNKVHVKMNCPPSADRNTMHQVFLLIKNKVK